MASSNTIGSHNGIDNIILSMWCTPNLFWKTLPARQNYSCIINILELDTRLLTLYYSLFTLSWKLCIPGKYKKKYCTFLIKKDLSTLLVFGISEYLLKVWHHYKSCSCSSFSKSYRFVGIVYKLPSKWHRGNTPHNKHNHRTSNCIGYKEGTYPVILEVILTVTK